MQAVEIIRAKRDGVALEPRALRTFVDAYTRGEVPDYQMSAFLMAVVFRGMTDRELGAWTEAMLHSGRVMSWPEAGGALVDKHSTGGVGDKISLPLAPLVALFGARVPMIAGRGLGHTGGTLDKLEAIPGFDVFPSADRFAAIVAELGAAIVGQTGEIAPADKGLYALRDVTGTVRCVPLIASSIMSKKLAEGLDALVLDVKVGSGAFMRTREEARELAETMIAIGQGAGCRTRAVLTRMDEPLGRAVGNALEVAECVEVMRGQGPAEIVRLTVELAHQMLALADPAGAPGRDELERALIDGRALKRFARMIEAQGGDRSVVDDPHGVMGRAPERRDFVAPRSGTIARMACAEIGMAALDLGAGRPTKEASIDPRAGLVFERAIGDEVEAGEVIAVMHASDASRFEAARRRLERAVLIGADPDPDRPDLVLEVLGA